MTGKVLDCSQERVWRGGWAGKVEDGREGEVKWAMGLSGGVTGFLTREISDKGWGPRLDYSWHKVEVKNIYIYTDYFQKMLP